MNNDLISRSTLKEQFNSLEMVTNNSSVVEQAEYKMLMTCISLIDNAPTVETYSEEDMCETTNNGYDIGYDFAKRYYEFDTEDFKKFVESRIDMQDLYLPIHFFDLLDEYRDADMKGGTE